MADEEAIEVEGPPKEATLGDEPMKSMKVETASSSPSRWDNWIDWMRDNEKSLLPAKYQLVTDENARRYSLYALRFSVVASSINTKVLTPNYPLMVMPGAHEDSFPSTSPFDFNSATYFIPMCTLLGLAISGLFIGGLSDRVGRKKVLLILSYVSTIGTIVKYFLRGSFWAYNIASFCFGFFLGNVPVAMAYVSDVFTNKLEKEHEMGLVIGFFVMGNSGGGMIAILMNSAGLFAPLWVGAGMSGLASLILTWYLIEPGDSRMVAMNEEIDLDDEEDFKRPDEINKALMWNVIIGALLDNIGSVGLFPLCLSPLALNQYLANPDLDEPLMTYTAYQWLSVCVALMVILSTAITPYIFARIGIAATCVFGNVFTAVVTVLLLMIANGPATEGFFIAFVCVMYAGFPFTVFSQLTTGPMLDVLAPEDKVGYVQGLNNMAMNFGMAFAPWLLGLLADATTTNTAIWTGVGVSLAAALCNFPLTFRKEMGKPIEKPPTYKRVLPGEDEALVQKILDGELVAPEEMFEINRQRIYAKKPALIPKVKPYSDEKDALHEIARNAAATFKFRKDMRDRVLKKIAADPGGEEFEQLCELINVSLGKLADTEGKQEAQDDLGKWVGEYLDDNGYSPHVNPVLIKQMVMTAFPSITRDKEFTPENIEEALVRQSSIMGHYMVVADKQRTRYSLRGILSTQPSQIAYT